MGIVTLTDENGNPVDFEIIADARIAQTDYLLLAKPSGDAQDEEETEVILVKDISSPEDEEAVYVVVDDEKELDTVEKYLRDTMDITLN